MKFGPVAFSPLFPSRDSVQCPDISEKKGEEEGRKGVSAIEGRHDKGGVRGGEGGETQSQEMRQKRGREGSVSPSIHREAQKREGGGGIRLSKEGGGDKKA